MKQGGWEISTVLGRTAVHPGGSLLLGEGFVNLANSFTPRPASASCYLSMVVSRCADMLASSLCCLCVRVCYAHAHMHLYAMWVLWEGPLVMPALPLRLPVGAVCGSHHGCAGCVHDAGHYSPGERGWHRLGQRREEK